MKFGFHIDWQKYLQFTFWLYGYGERKERGTNVISIYKYAKNYIWVAHLLCIVKCVCMVYMYVCVYKDNIKWVYIFVWPTTFFDAFQLNVKEYLCYFSFVF